MYANLDAESLRRLHRAVRGYGKNVLLYICYEDDEHPNGTVAAVAPGLLIGYIYYFGYSPLNEKLTSSRDLLIGICRRANEMVNSDPTHHAGSDDGVEMNAATEVNTGLVHERRRGTGTCAG